MAQALSTLTHEQRRVAAMRSTANALAMLTREAFEAERYAAPNRRGYGDAYELGAVGFARRGWSD